MHNIVKVVYQGGVTNLDHWTTDLEPNSNDYFDSNPDNFLNVKDSKSLLRLKEVGDSFIYKFIN